jgi:hypothetical protein
VPGCAWLTAHGFYRRTLVDAGFDESIRVHRYLWSPFSENKPFILLSLTRRPKVAEPKSKIERETDAAAELHHRMCLNCYPGGATALASVRAIPCAAPR